MTSHAASAGQKADCPAPFFVAGVNVESCVGISLAMVGSLLQLESSIVGVEVKRDKRRVNPVGIRGQIVDTRGEKVYGQLGDFAWFELRDPAG